MIVHDFDIERVAIIPDETDSPLLIDADAVLSLAIAVLHLPLPLHSGILARDLPYVDTTGYSRDRDPVIVPGIRLYVEL